MCDYSLHHVASRPAAAGDKLETTSFMGTTTLGFAAQSDPNVAVCLLPGTEIAFDRDVRYYNPITKFFTRKITHRTARFRQIDMDKPSVHHDALEFPDGRVVLLTRLREGQAAMVLQLPAGPHVATEARHHHEDSVLIG